MSTEAASTPEAVPFSPQPPALAHPSSDRLWSVLCHLSYFFGFALLAFLFPMTVYLVMKPDSPYVTHHAREALNFHLSLLLYLVCCVPLCLVVIGVPLIAAVVVLGVVCSIVAAVKASKGELYQYPATIRFVS